MKLYQIAKNAAVIASGDILTLYSYGEPLATHNAKSGINRKLTEPKSKTSKKHLKLFSGFITLYKGI